MVVKRNHENCVFSEKGLSHNRISKNKRNNNAAEIGKLPNFGGVS